MKCNGIPLMLVTVSLALVLALTSAHDIAYGLATWAKSAGGSGTDDVFRAIEPASGGGYTVAGYTDSFGAGRNDVWLLKVDEEGSVEWQRTYGGTGGDTARSIKQTQDGGFVVGGTTHSFTQGSSDFWVLKFDSNGDLQWQKSYGGPNSDIAHAIEPTSDGGYLVAGFTKSFGAQSKDYFVIKLDSAGVVQWQRRYGGPGEEVIRYAKQTLEGNYLVAGFSHSFGTNGDIMILKLDPSGNIIWQKAYGGGKFEEVSTILEVPDGYIIMEQTGSFSKNTDGWVFEIDQDGNIIWQKRYGGGSFDELSAARPTSDGGFVAAGETKSFGAGYEDFWVIKFDSGGNIEWEMRHGGSNIDEAEAIALTPEGGYVVVGTTKSFGVAGKDVWMLRLDSNGKVAQCAPGLTANATTTANVQATSAVPADTTAVSANTAVGIKSGKVIVGTTNATIMTQCGVSTINSPPHAENDSYTTDEDSTLNVPTLGVLANDTDIDGDTLSAILVSGPTNGALTLNSDGSLTYTPDDEFGGQDSFTYRANDGIADSSIATVTITVNAVNDIPLAVDDSYSTNVDTASVVVSPGVLENDSDVDGDTLNVFLDSGPNHGLLEMNADGSFTYTPDVDYIGQDSFTYKANDGVIDSNVATVTITINAA